MRTTKTFEFHMAHVPVSAHAWGLRSGNMDGMVRRDGAMHGGPTCARACARDGGSLYSGTSASGLGLGGGQINYINNNN